MPGGVAGCRPVLPWLRQGQLSEQLNDSSRRTVGDLEAAGRWGADLADDAARVEGAHSLRSP